MKNIKFTKYLLILILFLGISLRLNNINWDQGFHLHPDERFLTMVGNDIKIPRNFIEYLNPKTSTLNPYNNNYNFFVYGMFPVTINKFVAVYRNADNYNDFTTQGRALSAIFDWLIIIFVYKTLLLLEKKYKLNKSIKYWGAFFYSISVLPIQLSHFFAVDTFLNFFVFSSFYFALKYSLLKDNKNIVYSSILLGCAVASKITAFYILPINLFLILVKKNKSKTYIQLIVGYLLLLYITLRLADPYLFHSANLLNPLPSKLFIDNLITLKSFEGVNTWYPPAIQWFSKIPIIHSLYNLSFFGTGVFIFILFLYGVIITLRFKNNFVFKLILIWLAGIFIYHSTQFVQGLRYFFLMYPFIAIFAGFGISNLLEYLKRYKYYKVLISLIVFITLIWPLSFSQIYKKDHSRIEASKWIYKNINNKSVLLTEYWDDPIPLQVVESRLRFKSYEIPVFDMDTKLKWQKIDELLLKGDYLILSSNRGWGSIMKLPKKYPVMSNFYKNLLENKLEYKKIKEFKSFPTFYISGFNIKINDSNADESFTVYDHPIIIIFKKI